MAQYVTKIFFLKKEYWWGIATALGVYMPFFLLEKYNLLIQNNNNQTSPLLVSNVGRYIWGNSPFIFEITEKQIVVTSNLKKTTSTKLDTH